MPYPHQAGNPQFDGADAYEAYLNDPEAGLIPSTMIVSCPNCGGDGGWDEAYLGGDHEVHHHSSKCSMCGGKGEIEDEIVPRTLEDIESEDDREPCPYCRDVYTGLPGSACENCMNTGLLNPSPTSEG